ncbi:MAG: hypothetical protein HKN04_02610 [Rhodothermaceae bacterium]|nr:hypothetical protein [Rhodothermaceae bacterium]
MLGRLVAAVWVSVVFLGCAQAQTPIEIADGRAERTGPAADLSVWEERAAFGQAARVARAYWQGRDTGFEEERRVLAVAEGAFTRPEAEQHAILFAMSLWPRCCPKMGLVVIEQGQLVHHVAFEDIAQDLMAVPDLDGDGRDELATLGWFGMGGQMSQSLALLAFSDDGLSGWGGTQLSNSACAAGQSGTTAARVLALPGPEFLVEHYTQASCEEPTWQPVGEAEPLHLVPPEESPYVELPTE